MQVDLVALKEQAEVVGTIAGDMDPVDSDRSREKAALEGVWNLLHSLLDDLETKGVASLEVSP